MPHKVNFFLIGTGRSATTTLYHALAQHPQIFLPEVKEPHAFCTVLNRVSAYNKTADYRAPEDYEALYAAADAKSATIRGDFSVSCYLSPRSLRAIHAYNPEAIAVLLVRHPVDFLLSYRQLMLLYGHDARRIPSVEQLIAQRLAIACAEPYEAITYQALITRIPEAIREGRQLFGERFHVLFYDDFLADKDAFVARLLALLAADPMPLPLQLRNVSSVNMRGAAYHLATLPFRLVRPLDAFWRQTGMRLGLMRWLAHRQDRHLQQLKQDGQVGLISPEDYRALLHLCEPVIGDIARETGRDLSHWRGDVSV